MQEVAQGVGIAVLGVVGVIVAAVVGVILIVLKHLKPLGWVLLAGVTIATVYLLT